MAAGLSFVFIGRQGVWLIFLFFFYFFPSFIPNSASGGRGLHFSYYFWFLVLFSYTFLPSFWEKSNEGKMAGRGNPKKRILSNKEFWEG